MNESEMLKLSIKLTLEQNTNGKVHKANEIMRHALAKASPITQAVDDAFVAQLKSDHGIE
jgi:hypothetical protein